MARLSSGGSVEMNEFEGSGSLRLGELLVTAGILGKSDVEGHIALARFMGLPLGNLLVREGKISRDLLKVAIRLQIILAERLISLELVCRVLRDIAAETCSVDEMLNSLDSYSEKVRSCRLGELLVDAGLISEISLGRALVNSNEARKLLGQILVQQGALSAELVGAALSAQEKVRARLIDYKAAVAQLRQIYFISPAPVMRAC